MFSTEYKSYISTRTAANLIIDFARFFGIHHLHLAYHAAFPLALTPDLLYQIYRRFTPSAPWTSVSDLLLSNLCTEVGRELYAMDTVIRRLLLEELEKEFGSDKLNELNQFLANYTLEKLENQELAYENFLIAEGWTTLAYKKPREAAENLISLIQDSFDANSLEDLIRLTSIADTLNDFLLGKVDDSVELLAYCKGLAKWISGDLSQAASFFNEIPDQKILKNGHVNLLGKSLRIPIKDHALSLVDLGSFTRKRYPSNPQVNLQDLRSFIVQIRDTDNQNAVGTGFVVEGGYILTCAHVAMAAGLNLGFNNQVYRSFLERLMPFKRNESSKYPSEESIWVRFPQTRHSTEQDYRARIYASLLNEYEDDIAMLQLVDSSIPPDVGFAILGSAEVSNSNLTDSVRRFRSIGFRRLGDFDGLLWCDGEIQGFTDVPTSRKLKYPPLQLISPQVSSGMSGAPILDLNANLVVGIIAETWNSWTKDGKDRDTAFATPIDIVQEEPFNLSLYEQGRESITSNFTKQTNSLPNIDVNTHVNNFEYGSLNKLSELFVTSHQYAAIEEAWNNSEISFHEIPGEEIFSSPTKTEQSERVFSLKQIFVDLCSRSQEANFNLRPRKILWWDFNEKPDFEDFLNSVFSYMGIDFEKISSFELKISLVRAFFRESASVVIFKGFSSSQINDNHRSFIPWIQQIANGNSLFIFIK